MDINNNLTYLQAFANDEPVLFLEKIKIYPVKVKHLHEFNAAIQCLLFDPMDYNDIEIATLPRLYFLTEWLRRQTQPNYKEWLINNIDIYKYFALFERLLKLVLDPSYKYDLVQLGGSNYYSLRIMINPTEHVDITQKKFEELRQLILEQNSCIYSDEFIHNDIKQYVKEVSEKENNDRTLEDVRDSFMISMGIIDVSLINEMTIRRYHRMTSMLNSREEYLMARQAEMTGFVSFKQPLKHWTIIDNKPHLLDHYFKQA